MIAKRREPFPSYNTREQTKNIVATQANFPAVLTPAEKMSLQTVKSGSPDAVPGEEYDYEALPEGYGLAHNMLAGAFAGIAVSSC